MRGFASLCWTPGDGQADAVVPMLRERLHLAGWTLSLDVPGWMIAEEPRSGHMAQLIGDGHGVLIGTRFDRAATERGDVEAAAYPSTAKIRDFKALCAQLVSRSWGGYVALWHEPNGALQIFRDPIGMLECVSWFSAGLRVVTSKASMLLDLAPPAGLAIDWAHVADLLRFPAAASEDVPLLGIDTIPAGTLVRYDSGQQSERSDCSLWHPFDHVPTATRDRTRFDPADTRIVDACVRAWSSTTCIGVAELSGGFDSAVVAAGASSGDPSPIVAWYNYHGIDRPGDERRFARAVSERLGLPLVEVFREERGLSAEDFETMPIEVRPGLGSTSLFHDRDLAGRGAALGADMLLTGQGGDALFFQHATPLLAAELGSSTRSVDGTVRGLMDLAAWTETSIWHCLAILLAARFGGRSVPLPINSLPYLHLDRTARVRPLRWVQGTGRLAPGKQMQIHALAISRGAFGPSWCSARMDVIHPLLSQPLVERFLAISAFDLTQGRRDRAIARAAYADRLPALLIERRGKGRLTAFFGRMLARSSIFLQQFLLDGQLVTQRVLDAARLEAMLQPERLMQQDDYGDLLVCLLMEQWARTWTTRIGDMQIETRRSHQDPVPGADAMSKCPSNQAKIRV